MSDSLILYTGVFCFGLILLAVVLTVIEFRQMRRRHDEDATGGQRSQA